MKPVPAAEFSGNYTHNIDPKGRVTIPAAYREALGDGFTIGLNNQFNAIALYPVEKWQQMSDGICVVSLMCLIISARASVQMPLFQ